MTWHRAIAAAVLAAVAVLAMTASAASAATRLPPSVIGNGSGCLTPAKATPRAPVDLTGCKPNGGSYIWAVLKDGKIRLRGTRDYLGADKKGILLRGRAQAPIWVYGPGHTLAIDGTLWLTWCPGSSTDRPWVTAFAVPGCQTWDVFTKVTPRS